MLFSKLLPREGNFFTLFNQLADEMVNTATSFKNLVENYDNLSDRETYTKAVVDAEHAADKVTVEILHLLHKTFITPIERESMHALTNGLDDVADALQDTAQALSLYDVSTLTPEMYALAEISVECCEELRKAVYGLKDLSKNDVIKSILTSCSLINELESKADREEHKAISALFRKEPDVRELIKLKAMYEQLEDITDRCEDVSNIIEGIVLENS